MLVMRNPDDARIHHNRFGPEANCEWPLGCCARGANLDHQAFVNRWRRIKILPDIFSINNDHLIADRYNQETRMINLCALHNRQKQDGLLGRPVNGGVVVAIVERESDAEKNTIRYLYDIPNDPNDAITFNGILMYQDGAEVCLSKCKGEHIIRLTTVASMEFLHQVRHTPKQWI